MIRLYTTPALRLLRNAVFEAHHRGGQEIGLPDLAAGALRLTSRQRTAAASDDRDAPDADEEMSTEPGDELPLSEGAIRVLQQVAADAEAKGADRIGAADLLRVLLDDAQVGAVVRQHAASPARAVQQLEELDELARGDARDTDPNACQPL